MSTLSGFSFTSLFAQSDSTEHWGHIRCHCGHHANETVKEARTAGRIHLNGECLWSCCGANWSDMCCSAPISKNKPLASTVDMDEMEISQEESANVNKFRRYLPTFYSQELICLVCFKPYKSPVKLACGHSLCAECLKRTVDYQRAAGSFSSRFRAGPVVADDELGEGDSAKAAMNDPKMGNLRLRQMTRTQRRILFGGSDKKEDQASGDEPIVICPVCSRVSFVSHAIEDTDTISKMKQLAEQREKRIRPKCAFCTSATLAGAPPEESQEATLVCATCGPICARHHALLHIAGPPTFRCHEVSEQEMELLPLMDLVPHQYEICPKHGCEMDLYDKKTKRAICEVCASSINKNEVAARIIREEDKMAFLLEEESKAKERVAMEKKSREERLREQEKSERDQVAALQQSLAESVKSCDEVLEKSQSLYSTGKLTGEVDGLTAVREDVRKLFAETHKALEEMQKQTEEEISKVIADADKTLTCRYEASKALLKEAQETSRRAAGVPLDEADVRAMLIKRLRDVQNSLKIVQSLPVEPVPVANLFTLKQQPDALKSIKLATVVPAEGGLFAAASDAVESEPAAAAAAASDDQPPMEDDDTILERIRAELKKDESDSRRSRENGRYSTIKSSLSSGMPDSMKREAIAAIIFERGESVLGAPFEEVIMVAETFSEKNSLEHILDDLSAPADFNREMRAIYAFLKKTNKLP